MLSSLRGEFRRLAQAVIAESPACPDRTEAVRLLVEAQDAAGPGLALSLAAGRCTAVCVISDSAELPAAAG